MIRGAAGSAAGAAGSGGSLRLRRWRPENLCIRAKMMMALTGYIKGKKITQSRAARIMGVAQPRISDLVRGKIGRFTIDTLVNMVSAAGLKVDVDITTGRPRAKNKQVA